MAKDNVAGMECGAVKNVPVSDIGYRLRDVTVWHGASLSLSHWVAQIDLSSRYERNFEPTRSSLRSVNRHIAISLAAATWNIFLVS